MAAGRPLAEAFVRISPDDSGFGRKLKKQMEGAVGPAGKVIDQGLVKKLGVQIEDSNRRIAKSQLGVKDAELGLTAAREKLTKVTQDATATDAQKAKASLAVERAELKHADALASVKKSQDHARASSAALSKALAGQGRESKDAEVSTRGLGRELHNAFAGGIDVKQLNTLAQKLRDIRVLSSATIGPIKNMSAQIGKMAVVAGAASAGIVGGAGLSGGILALAGALAQVAGAAPVAVSGLAALGAVVGTVKIATAGVAEGFSQVVKAQSKLAAGAKLSKADIAKLDQSLKSLAPNARKLVLVFADLFPALRKIQQAIQQRFFQGFAADVKSLGERYLPTLAKAGKELAAVLGDTVRGALIRLNRSTTQWNLASVLDDAKKAAQGLAGPIARLPSLLIDIAAAAGPAFRGLAQDASRVLSSLVDKLQGAVDSGALAKGIEKGIAAVKNLGSIIHSVFSAIHSAVTAATHVIGGNLLTSIGDVAKKFSDFLKSAQGQNSLRAVFAAALPVLRSLGGLLSVVGPALAGLAPVVLALADAFIAGLRPVIPVAADLAKTLGTALIPVLPAVSALAVALGGALGEAILTLQPIIAPLATAIATLLSPTGALNALFRAIAPILVPLATGLASVVGTLGGGLVTALQTIAPKLPALAQAFADVAGALSQALVDALITVLPLLPTLIQQTTDLLTAVTPLIPPLVFIAKPLLWLGAAITTVLSPIASLTHVLTSVKELVAQLGPIFSVMFRIATAAVFRFAGDAAVRLSAWIGVVAALPGRVAAALGVLTFVVRTALGNAMRAGLQTVVLGIGTILGYFRGLPGRIVGMVGDLSGVLANAGRSIIQGLIDGIQSMFSALASKLGQVTSLIPKLKGPPPKDRRLLEPAGRSIMAGLVGGIEAGRIDLARTLASVTGQVGGANATINTTGGGQSPAGGYSAAALRDALSGLAIRFDGDGLARLVTGRQAYVAAAGGRR